MANNLSIRSMHAKAALNEPIEYGKSFTRGVSVSHHGLTWLFISGTASLDNKGRTLSPGNFKAQAQRTFENVTALLNSEGADWSNVVKTTCYLKDMKYYDQFNECRNAFYKAVKVQPFPASVCVQAHLCRKELLVEMDATAVVLKTPRLSRRVKKDESGRNV